MRSILLTGASGQLGNELRNISSNYPDDLFYFTDVYELDITRKDLIKDFFDEKRISHVINCAAYTAVDKAEEEKERAMTINALAVRNLAEVAQSCDAHMVHISTDFVFDGSKNTPYHEDDIPNPLSVYGQSKLAGEFRLKETEVLHTIIRTSWLYSPYGNNFVKSMIKYGKERGELKVVFDQVGTPTYACDLAAVIMQVIDKEVYGLYHYSNEGVISWYDFAKTIIDLWGIDCKVSPIPTSEYPLPAHRPAYSVLDKGNIKKALEMEIPYWRDSLLECKKRMDAM